MKKIVGIIVFSAVSCFMLWGIITYGPANVLIPGLSASAVGLVLLGGIKWIRGERA